jgi:hypothetical protein
MSINGSLKDHTFLEVIAILSSSGENGRLHVNFSCGQSSFDFVKGELTAAYVGALTGFSAVNVALHMNGTQFRFVPNDSLGATHFSDKNERLLLNRLLGTLPATSQVEPSLEDSTQAQRNPAASNIEPSLEDSKQAQPNPGASDIEPSLEDSMQAQPNPPSALQPTPELEQFPNREYFQVESVRAFGLPSLILTEKRSRASWAVSILLIGVLAAVAIAAFRARPVQQGASQTSPQPMAQVTLEKNDASSDSADKRSTLSDHASSPTQSVSKNTRHELPPTTPSNNDSTKPHKAEPGISAEASGERSVRLERSFREIPVVIRVEDGHVAEAYVSNHKPGMEAYESTAIRLARQRRYPKDQLGTQTIVFRVSSEQQGVPKQ